MSSVMLFGYHFFFLLNILVQTIAFEQTKPNDNDDETSTTKPIEYTLLYNVVNKRMGNN